MQRISRDLEERSELSLVEALELGNPPGLIAVVGGGGKSTLLFALARALPGRTVLTTTTRIFASQARLAHRVSCVEDVGWESSLVDRAGSLLVVGRVEERHALGVGPEIPGQILAHPNVDWVVVEADGSRRLPVKAPAEHEPVIPPETHHLITVAGIDALSAPIAEIAHRPERVCALTGLSPDATLSPEALGALLASPAGGGKGSPRGARRTILINKVESEAEGQWAARVASAALGSPGLERVAAGALQGDPESGWRAWSP
ncbi:MAG: selenium cofactor biosynthesis protein YqeC [Myxococcota bacterium]|nr:selenium cofactor biosynthesis protein YqeC [Myxococcota bacterium]